MRWYSFRRVYDTIKGYRKKDAVTYSKRHNKFLLPVLAKAISEGFCKTESKISNVINYNSLRKEYGKMNPASIMKIMNMKNEFNRQHPKFMAFTKAVFARGIQEGSVIEISVKNPGEEEMAANIKVQASDLELLQEIRELMGQG